MLQLVHWVPDATSWQLSNSSKLAQTPPTFLLRSNHESSGGGGGKANKAPLTFDVSADEFGNAPAPSPPGITSKK